MQYEGINRAAMAITLDNGGLNIHRPIEQVHAERDAWLATKQPTELLPIDEWLRTLTEDEMFLLCAGGADDPAQEALLAKGPAGTNELLDDYFEKVC